MAQRISQWGATRAARLAKRVTSEMGVAVSMATAMELAGCSRGTIKRAARAALREQYAGYPADQRERVFARRGVEFDLRGLRLRVGRDASGVHWGRVISPDGPAARRGRGI